MAARKRRSHIGNFDGVHTGHRRLLAAVCAAAATAGLHPAAMTFEPHPLAVLRPQAPLARLGGCAEKVRLLRDCGIGTLFMPRFNRRLAEMPAEEFADALFARLRVRHLIVGENFRFGRRGRGDFAMLAAAAARYDAQVRPLPLVECGGAPISSGRVRQALQDGDFALAAQLLARPWELCGRVQRGDGRAREWGFPTANLAIRFNPPLRGIFAARATIFTPPLRGGAERSEAGGVGGAAAVSPNHPEGTQPSLPSATSAHGADAPTPPAACGSTPPQGGGKENVWYAAAVSIGTNPTVTDANIVRVEAHLLDVDADLYGMKMRLQPLRKLRDEQKFESIAALKEGGGAGHRRHPRLRMKPLYTVAETRAIEQAVFAVAPSFTLMQRAGAAVAEAAREMWEEAGGEGEVLAIAGGGNNGGDAAIAAAELRRQNVPVRLLLAADADTLPADAARALREWQDVGGTTFTLSLAEDAGGSTTFTPPLRGGATSQSDVAGVGGAPIFTPSPPREGAEQREAGGGGARSAPLQSLPRGEDGKITLPPATVLIDGLFGIGLSRAPEGIALELIAAMNRHPAPVCAVDIPSGIAADSGNAPGGAAAAVDAARTISFFRRQTRALHRRRPPRQRQGGHRDFGRPAAPRQRCADGRRARPAPPAPPRR